MSVFGKGVRRCVGFTGQGSQWVGMGRDVLEKVPGVGERLKEVKEVLGIDIEHIMLSSDEVLFLTAFQYRKRFVILDTRRSLFSHIRPCFWIIFVYSIERDILLVIPW